MMMVNLHDSGRNFISDHSNISNSQNSILIASVIEHEDFIDFSSNEDAGVQRVSCVSVSTEEDFLYTPDRTFIVTFQTVESGDRFEGPNQIMIEIVENGKT